MRQITVKLPDDTAESLEDVAESQFDGNRSKAIRELLQRATEVDDLKREYEERIDELREKYEADLAEREQEYEQEIERLNEEHEERIDELRAEYEERITELEDEIERVRASRDDLQRQLRETNRRVDEHQELVRTVERQQSLAERRARAGLLTKTKWALFGMSDDSDE